MPASRLRVEAVVRTEECTMRACGFVLLLVACCLICGCHSDCFQTAKIKDGASIHFGTVMLDDAASPGYSDYSAFIKGEIGRSATPDRFGYSFAMTFVSPFQKDERDFIGKSSEPNIAMYPNEYAAALPEVKIQMPRVLPVDVALGGRLFAVFPDRATLFASRDIGDRLTAYSDYSLSTTGQMLHAGFEANITSDLSVFVEYTSWLDDYDYPAAAPKGVPALPSAIGLCVSYKVPRR